MGDEGWIPVAGRMPEEGQDVLIFLPRASWSLPEIRMVATRTDRGWCPLPEHRHADVTHWHPLPGGPRPS